MFSSVSSCALSELILCLRTAEIESLLLLCLCSDASSLPFVEDDDDYFDALETLAEKQVRACIECPQFRKFSVMMFFCSEIFLTVLTI
jgi:hypothetical protein